MSNAKGSGKGNKLVQPSKVVAQSRTEVNAVSSQDLRQKAQRVVAMPAAAVRAVIASATKNAIPAVRVAYDVLNRLITFVETGHAVDLALLKTIKRTINTAFASDAITQKNISKVLNDITLLNDVVFRVVSYNRVYIETVGSADLPAKSLTKAPFVNTAHSVDSRLLLIGKNKSDSLTFSDSFTKIVVFNRNLVDTVQSADVKSFAINKPRTETARSTDLRSTQVSKPKFDTFNLADLSKLNLGKVINDISSASDSDKITFTKRINDFVSAIHQANVDYAFTNSEVNLTQISDTLTRLISFVRLFTDVARPIDTLSRVVSKPRTETPLAADNFVRVVQYNKVFTDTQTTVDLFTRVAQYNRVRLDTSTVTDIPAKLIIKAPFVDISRAADITARAFSKTRVETASSVDVFNKVVQFNRNFNSTVSSAQSIDIFSAVRQYNRLFFDIARSTDQFVKVTNFNRLPVETAMAADVLIKTMSRNFVDVSQATDLFARVVVYNRITIDTARAADVLIKTMFRPRNFVDISRAADLITAKFVAKKLQDLVGASDIFVITGNIIPGAFPPADQTKLRDIFVKLVSFIRTFSDTAKAQDIDVYTLNKTAGSTYRVLNDFNGLVVDFDTSQTLDTFRTELINVAESIGKRYDKIANKQLTFYYDAYPLTDFAELTFANGVVFDQDQLFTYTDPYQADSERVLIGDVVTKISQSVRGFTEIATANEAVGRSLSRTVGDVRSRVFDDVADLFYVNEYYSTANGVDAVVQITNNYPVFGVVITNTGAGYTVGQVFNLITPNGNAVAFTVDTINGTGGILTVNNIIGTAPIIIVQQSYFNDYAGLTFGLATLDQDTAQFNALTFTFPGPNIINVGPRSAEAKRSVVGQEMQFTLKEKADGDTAKYTDFSSKQINKQARRFLPQGIFDDYAGLTFGTEYDMDLTQTLSKSYPESVSIIDITSRATLGPTKRNSDIVNSIDVKATTLGKPRTDTTNIFEVFTKRYEKSAGAYANTSWRDYNEISGFALSALLEMPIEYEGRFELILIPDTVGKSITKPLHFESYVWRDFNELSFGSNRDESLTFSWYNDSPSDISRTMDDARRTISPNKSDSLLAQETFGKDIIIGGIGDARNPGQFRDFLGLIPIGEHGVDGMPIMDEELLFKINPGSRLDTFSSTDSHVKRIEKYVIRTVPPYWSDPAELTFGTTYDQELVQYQPTTRDESFIAADLFTKVSTIIRGLNDIVRANDSMLLSKNGLTNSTYVFAPIPDAVRSQDTSGRQIVKAVGDYKSQSSLWQDFVELTVSFDLEQYYLRGPDSTLDISRTMDVKSNFFSKQAGRIQNILNVNTFDSDVFFDIDLLQTFAQDYVTEIIRTTEERTLSYSAAKAEIITLPEFFGKSIIKPGIGDTIVDDWTDYSPLYLNYFSDLEDSLQSQYPPHRIDVARSTDTRANFYNKQAGFDAINKWYTNFEYLSNDETNVREGVIENRDNTFAQTKFTNYLDEIIYEYHEEQIKTPFRVENIKIDELFTRVLNTVRIFTEVNTASDQPSLTVTPATKTETQNASDVNIKQYNKTAGENLYTIWTDYNEFNIDQQDLTQYYEPYRVEYLQTIDVYVNRFTKARADTARTPDNITRSVGLGKNENTRSVDALGKFINKPQVGDSTLTAWYDSYEILSYDPTLLTYGEIITTRFDIGRANDTVGKTYTVKPGEVRSRTWLDFNEFEIVNAEALYWKPYTVEPVRATDSITQKVIGKGLIEIPRSSDGGAVRVFSSNSYIRDASPYYASDYLLDGIVTSTF